MLEILSRNILGYDMIIIIAAVINGFFIYPKTKRSSLMLRDHLQPRVYVPINMLVQRVKGTPEKKIDLNALKSMRSDEIHLYSIFSAFNGAFPMLGMLGTILSLLRMLDLTQQQVIMNFTVALTSTFWGLIFALIFKAIDAGLNPIVEQNQENLKLIFERIDLATRLEDAHE